MARPRIYSFNETYFNLIDTPEKAYWLGYLYADGCITINNKIINGKSYQQYFINLVSKDLEILEKFTKSINCNSNIISKIQDKYYQIQLTSKIMFNDLQNQGCIQRKSLVLTFPNLQSDLVSHFIRGYFDGDGSVYSRKISKKYKNHTAIYNSGGVSINGTLEFLTDLRLNIFFLFNSKQKVEKENRKTTNTYYTRISGIKRLKMFYDFIYNNSTIELSRKKNKFEEIFKERASTTIIGNPIRKPKVWK